MPASETAPTVSVVVCAFTPARAALLALAVASLQRQTRAPDELIVVIDHSAPLLAWAREHLTGVRVVENRGPRGLAGARNAGVWATSSEVVAFLDDDAVAAPDWLQRFAGRLRRPSCRRRWRRGGCRVGR